MMISPEKVKGTELGKKNIYAPESVKQNKLHGKKSTVRTLFETSL